MTDPQSINFIWAELYLAIDDLTDLADAGPAICKRLDLNNYEERQSANYAGGFYFRARVEDIEYQISYSDDNNAEELMFRIWIEDLGRFKDEQSFSRFVDVIAIENFKESGCSIARVYDNGKDDWRMMRY